MNFARLIVLPLIACALALGGCATNAPLNAPSFDLPPVREDTIGRLAIDGRNAFVNGAQVPHGVYLRDGDTVTTGPATSVSVVLNSGASIQLDQNTDPLFRLIRQGACVLMELFRGQAAVASGGTCVEFTTERLNTAGVAHSLINIRAAEIEVRVTVIEGQVDMLRPGLAALRTYDEYVSTAEGTWQVRQLTPAAAAAAGSWTRAYFRPVARPAQPDYLVPALTAIGVAIGVGLLNKDSGDKHPPAASSQWGSGTTPDQSHSQTATTAPTPVTSGSPVTSGTPGTSVGPVKPFIPINPIKPDKPIKPVKPLGPVTPIGPGTTAPGVRTPAGAAGAADRIPVQPLGLCCLPSGGSTQATMAACAARKGAFHPAATDPHTCPSPIN